MRERKEHVQQLQRLTARSRPHELLIIGTDINDHIGIKTNTTPRGILGRFGIGRAQPPTRTSLTHSIHTFLHRNRLCAATTFFQHGRRHGYATYSRRTTRGMRHFQLDHIFIRQRHLQRTDKAWIPVDNGVNSDHRRTRIVFRNVPYPRRREPKKHKPDVEELLDKDSATTQRFVAAVRRRCRGVNDPQRLLNQLQTSIRDGINDLPAAVNHNSKEWYADSANLLKPLLQAKALARERKKQASLQGNRRRHRHACMRARTASRIYDAAKKIAINKWARKLAHKINAEGDFDMARAGTRESWAILRNLASGHSSASRIATMLLRDPDTNKISEDAQRSATLYQQYLERAHSTPTPYDENAINEIPQRPIQHHMSNTPTLAELKAAIKRQRNGKAQGPDRIPVEAYKALAQCPATLDILHQVISGMWNTGSYSGDHVRRGDNTHHQRRCIRCRNANGQCPGERDDTGGLVYVQFLVAKHIHIPKKGDRSDPANWRSICLLDVLSTILTTIMATRMREISESILQDYQCGFRPGRGCRDCLWIVYQSLCIRRQHGLPTWAIALDFRAAFRTISREALYRILARLGCPHHFINVLKRLCTGAKFRGTVNGIPFEVITASGVRTGDTAGPGLFNMAMAAVALLMRWPRNSAPQYYAHPYMSRGGAYDEAGGDLRFTVPAAIFADDSTLLATSRQFAEQVVTEAIRVVKRLTGMDTHLSAVAQPRNAQDRSKTVAMVCPPPGRRLDDYDTSPITLMVDGQRRYIHFHTEICYLGTVLHYDLGDNHTVHKRIGVAAKAFDEFRRVLTSRILDAKVKGRLLRAVVLTKLLYSSETWVLDQHLCNKVRVFWNRCCRRALHITSHQVQTQRISNSTVFRRLGVEAVDYYIRHRRLCWAGNMVRMSTQRLPRLLLTARCDRPEHPQPRLRHAPPSPPAGPEPGVMRPPGPPPPLQQQPRRRENVAIGVQDDSMRRRIPQWVSALRGNSPVTLRVGSATTGRSRCRFLRTQIQQGSIRIAHICNNNSQHDRCDFYSLQAVMIFMARTPGLAAPLLNSLQGKDALSPEHQQTIHTMLTERSARTVADHLRPPAIEPVITMPWTCSRCRKVYVRNRHHAEAHADEDSCSTPVPRQASQAPVPANAPVYGRRRNLRWLQQLRTDLRDDDGIKRRWPRCAQCARTTRDEACNRCFFLNWAGAAQRQDTWTRIVYGPQDQHSHAARSRARRWTQPAQAWEDPRHRQRTRAWRLAHSSRASRRMPARSQSPQRRRHSPPP